MTTTWRNPLKRGMHGDDVREWQGALAAVGMLNAVDVGGDFGPLTEKATIRFQLEHGLVPDGLVGPKTRAKIGVIPAKKPIVSGIFDTRWHFVQAKNYTKSAGRFVSMIPIHSIQAPNRPDTARGELPRDG